jgi:hypothetical protein
MNISGIVERKLIFIMEGITNDRGIKTPMVHGTRRDDVEYN